MLRILIAIFTFITIATTVGAFVRGSPFGIVEGIKDCGSAGKLGNVWVSDCIQTPCHFVPNYNYDIAIRFTAQSTSDNLALFVYHTDSSALIYYNPINGEIQGGIEHELKFVLPVTDSLAGTAFNIHFYILDLIKENIEVCASAAVTVGW